MKKVSFNEECLPTKIGINPRKYESNILMFTNRKMIAELTNLKPNIFWNKL